MFKQSLYTIFIEDNRWLLLLQGLWATVVITLLSLAFGTLLGGCVYFATRNRRHWLRNVAKWYRVIVRGTPLMVLLLLFYYVVLRGSGGIWAAIIAFSLNFSNFACSIIQSSIDSVGRGQIEAGRALGLNRIQILRYIIAPQALRNALPAYKFQAVSLVKGTSVVGYVAIVDLAQATEAIRTGTGMSLLPLVVVTAIYFMLAWMLNKLLDTLVKSASQI
ncbi:MAG: amino acid ABC transporter permease [Bacteroidales bacterium]|nr:amino acid ABC transporter permease [Bacteroidales bacterium]